MADITIPVIGGASKRLKDMGDGTHAEVVATALSLDGVQIEGGGLTSAESAALQAVATAFAQATQITHEAAIRAAVESLAALVSGGRLAVAPSLPSGAAADITLQSILGRLPAALSAGRLAVETLPASGAISVVRQPPVLLDAVSIAGGAAGVTLSGGVIDLGLNFSTCTVLVVAEGKVNQADAVFIKASADGITGWSYGGRPDGSTGAGVSWTNAAGSVVVAQMRPHRRFVQASIAILAGGSAQPANSFLATAVHWGV